MRRFYFIPGMLIASAVAVVGCQRGKPMAAKNAPPGAASTQPIIVPPVTDGSFPPDSNVSAVAHSPSAAAVTGASTLTIDHQPARFGPAMLRLTKVDGKVNARLYSNDPRDVATGAETANSYDFNMSLPEIDDPADIAKAVWTYKSPSSDRQDSPYGIFLNKEQRLLQPMDVTVRFQGTAPNVQVLVQGVFWMFRTTDDVPAVPSVMVRVIGVLNAEVPEK